MVVELLLLPLLLQASLLDAMPHHTANALSAFVYHTWTAQHAIYAVQFLYMCAQECNSKASCYSCQAYTVSLSLYLTSFHCVHVVKVIEWQHLVT